MMVRTSVRVDSPVSMHGWAIRYRTTNYHLPLPHLPTNLHLHPASSRLPYQDLGNGNHQIGSLASPGETSRHSSNKNQAIQNSCER
jgi:hypothetical protein